MVESALEGLGFKNIKWKDTEPEELEGDYSGPAKSFNKPSQIIWYKIHRQPAPTVPGAPATPNAPIYVPPPTPKQPETIEDKAKAFLQGPGIGWAILLDIGLVLAVRHFFKGKKAPEKKGPRS